VTTDGPSTQRSTGESPATTAELLEVLRARMVPSEPLVPSEALRTAFEAGLGATAPLPAPMPRPRRVARRRLAAVGAVAILALGGTGAAGALPGSAQDAFDRTAEAVGLSRRATPAQVPTTDPADPADVEAEEHDDGTGTTPAGQTFAEERVVPDASDPAAPGIEPGGVADDARDLGPEGAPAPADDGRPGPPPIAGPDDHPGPAQPGAPVDAGEPPSPADELAPERPGAGDDPRTSRPGGAP
jgi:hypothetical protein